MLNGLPATFAGSNSNPNVADGVLNASVTVAVSVAITRGVLLSVLGGDPQKFQVVPVVNRDDHTGATSATLGIKGTF